MTAYLFFDIDGTLVSKQKGQIPSAAEAIAKTRAKGNKVFISTGRHLGGLGHIRDIERDGIIFCNGAGIYLDGKILSSHPIPADVIAVLRAYAEEREGMYSLQSYTRSYKNDHELQRMRNSLPDDPRFETFEEMMEAFGASPICDYDNQEILKVDFGFPDEERMNAFLAQMDPRIQLVSQAGTNVALGRKSGEITCIGVDKGTAIREVCRMLGADLKDTYAFGDSGNDTEMLKTCAVGVAVGNANAQLKSVADYVAKDIEEDGIADAMSHLGLI